MDLQTGSQEIQGEILFVVFGCLKGLDIDSVSHRESFKKGWAKGARLDLLNSQIVLYRSAHAGGVSERKQRLRIP